MKGKQTYRTGDVLLGVIIVHLVFFIYGTVKNLVKHVA
jgi:hypothetical protein